MTISPAVRKLNELVTIQCSADGNPPVNNYHFFLKDNFIGSSTNGRHTFTPIDCLSYTGTHKCSASSRIGSSPNVTEFVQVSDLANSESVNITLSPSAVEIGKNITLTIDFTFSATYFQSLSCGYGTYGTGSGANHLVTWNQFLSRFVLEIAAFPVEYNGRITTRGKIITISNVPFGEEGRKFDCDFKYYLASGTLVTAHSNNPGITAVYALPWFGENSMTSTSEIIEGQNATLKCNVTSRPASSITWSYDNSIITATQNNSSITNGDYQDATSILTIVDVSQAMHGENISCTATPVYGDAIHKTTSLTVVYLPKITAMTISPAVRKLNELVTVQCSAVGNPPVTNYHFFLNDNFIGSSTNGTYTFTPTDCLSYTGTYKCSASSRIGSSLNITEFVQVSDPVIISPKLTSKTVNETTNVTFQCMSSGCPVPTITWTKIGDSSFIASGNSLLLTSVTNTHASTYKCLANNSVTNDTSQATLTVNYKPITTSLVSATLKPVVNSQVTMTCNADAYPTAMYKFYQVMPNGTETEISSSSSQTSGNVTISSIKTVTGTFNVTYKCVPYNFLGQGVTKEVTFDVQVPPTVTATMTPSTVNTSGSAILQCAVTPSNPPATVTAYSPSNTTISLFANNTALIANVTRAITGRFSCRAQTGIGSPSLSYASLLMNHKPENVVLTASSYKPLNGQSVTLNCASDSVPAATYKFYRVQGAVETELANAGGSGVLTINAINYKDLGSYNATYKCIASNMLGSVSAASNAFLDIQVLPELSVSENRTITEGENASFKCTVIAANPTATITWLDASNRELSHSNGNLSLTNVTRHQAGQYRCKADNNVTGSPVFQAVTLTVNYKPENVVLTASSYKPLNGASVTLNCTSDSVPAATYKFYRVQGANETELANAGGSGVLTINAINYKDLGSYNVTYKCIANNMLGSALAASNAFLDIQVLPELSVSENRTITEGENASFKCTVIAANPTATITWLDSSNQELSHSNGNLSLTNVTRRQAGQYPCKADNNVTGSPVFQTVTLTVNFAPMNVMLTTGSNMTVVNGSSLSITCSSQAVPAAEYDFYVVIGGVSSVVSSLNSRSTGVLQIGSITTDLSTYKTMYKCMPRNSIGNGTMKQLEFNVHVPPSDMMISPDVNTFVVNENQTVTLSCSVRYGNPSPTIKWTSSVVSDVFTGNTIVFNSVNRTNAKAYTCSASNSVKTTTRSIALTVQYGPERVSPNVVFVYKCETQSYELSCIANGVPIPDAYIKFPNRGGRTPTYPGNASIRISSLAAGDFGLYLCTFHSVVGRLHVAQVLFKTVLPGPVRNLAIKSENGEFEVSWDAPICKSSSGIKEYRIRYKKKGATSWIVAGSPTSSPFKISNVDNGQKYTIEVLVVNGNGGVGSPISKTATGSTKCECPETDVIRNVNTYIEPAHNYTDLKTINEEVRPYQALNTVSNINNQNQSHYMELTEKTRAENQPYASLSLYE
eukprot:gene11271-12451_t